MQKTTINKNSRGDFPVLPAFWLDDSYLPVCFRDPHQQLASFLVFNVSCVTCATWYPVCKLEFSLFSFLFQLWSKVSHLINRSAVQCEVRSNMSINNTRLRYIVSGDGHGLETPTHIINVVVFASYKRVHRSLGPCTSTPITVTSHAPKQTWYNLTLYSRPSHAPCNNDQCK